MHQPSATHSSYAALSRVDRIYARMENADLLDRDLATGVLDWDFRTPSHRPVFFSRRTPSKPLDSIKPLPCDLLKHPDWAPRTARRLHALVNEESASNGIHRLALLRRAIRDSTVAAISDRQWIYAETKEDQLSCAMAFIRAVESGSLGGDLQMHLPVPAPLLPHSQPVCRRA